MTARLHPPAPALPALPLPGVALPLARVALALPRVALALPGVALALPGVALALAGVSLLSAPSAGSAQETVPALEAAASRYREVSAICADFEQVIELRLLRRTVASAGRICQRRPNLFSMRFTDPDGDMLIADGEHVWLYYPSIDAQQVIRRPAAQSPGREDFFREFLEDTGTRYRAEETGSEEVDGRDCRVVVLTPLEGASYRRARLWLDAQNHLIRRVEVHEPGDRIRTVTLRAIDLAATPDPALFVFEVPEGARVAGPPGADDGPLVRRDPGADARPLVRRGPGADAGAGPTSGPGPARR